MNSNTLVIWIAVLGFCIMGACAVVSVMSVYFSSNRKPKIPTLRDNVIKECSNKDDYKHRDPGPRPAPPPRPRPVISGTTPNLHMGGIISWYVEPFEDTPLRKSDIGEIARAVAEELQKRRGIESDR